MIKPVMFASWAFAVTFFHAWAFALFWDWSTAKCGALLACAFAWLVAAVVLTAHWTDRQEKLREERSKKQWQ